MPASSDILCQSLAVGDNPPDHARLANRLTVLVVDDETQFAAMLRMMLEIQGHRVLVATSLDTARSAAASQPVDVAIVSQEIAGSRGTELVAHLKGCCPTVGIVLYTSWKRKAAVLLQCDPPADAVLEKPFRYQELRAALDRIVQRRQHQELVCTRETSPC
ncbi:MAG: response regulator [Chloroflexi bacterium]|nr:response regulator [Chloroflexota bacterium]